MTHYKRTLFLTYISWLAIQIVANNLIWKCKNSVSARPHLRRRLSDIIYYKMTLYYLAFTPFTGGVWGYFCHGCYFVMGSWWIFVEYLILLVYGSKNYIHIQARSLSKFQNILGISSSRVVHRYVILCYLLLQIHIYKEIQHSAYWL